MMNKPEILDPDDIYAIARLAYAELAMSGVTTVGEFHYLHHDKVPVYSCKPIIVTRQNVPIDYFYDKVDSIHTLDWNRDKYEQINKRYVNE